MLYPIFSKIKTGICTLILAAISACGGSVATAGTCQIPHEVTISKLPGDVLKRTIKMSPTSPEQIVATGHDATLAIFDCPGEGTQYLSFTLSTINYLNSTVGDHIAILTKGAFDMQVPKYTARGILISPVDGVKGEKFVRDANYIANICQNNTSTSNGVDCGNPAAAGAVHPMIFDDYWQGTEYNVALHSIPGNIAYTINKSSGGTVSQAWHEDVQHTYLQGTSIGFAVLCKDPQNACDASHPFVVKFKNINAGWF